MFEAYAISAQALAPDLAGEARAMGEFALQGERCSRIGWSWDPAPLRLSAQRRAAGLTDAQRSAFETQYQAGFYTAQAQAEMRARFTTEEDARRWFATQTAVCANMAARNPGHLSRHSDGDRIERETLAAILAQFD